MYTNRVFGTAKCVLFIEVSLFQGVLNEFHCSIEYIYVQCHVYISCAIMRTFICVSVYSINEKH